MTFDIVTEALAEGDPVSEPVVCAQAPEADATPDEEEPVEVDKFAAMVCTEVAVYFNVGTHSVDTMVTKQVKQLMEYYIKWRGYVKDTSIWEPTPTTTHEKCHDLAKQGQGPACPFKILGSIDGSTFGWADYCIDPKTVILSGNVFPSIPLTQLLPLKLPCAFSFLEDSTSTCRRARLMASGTYLKRKGQGSRSKFARPD